MVRTGPPKIYNLGTIIISLGEVDHFLLVEIADRIQGIWWSFANRYGYGSYRPVKGYLSLFSRRQPMVCLQLWEKMDLAHISYMVLFASPWLSSHGSLF